jgi:GMP synthase (glutamine-hydrolysing)
MKVLIIDNTRDRDCWGSADLSEFVVRSPDRTAFVRRAPEEDLPVSIRGFDRIILSGSRSSCHETGPWVSKVDHLIRTALQEAKPILGVCYGHQALSRVLGGPESLRKAATGEYGWIEVEIVERAPLFEGLSDRFWSFASHSEEISTLPKGMRLLARTADCAVQACRLEDLPVYGVQFHPEKNFESATRSIENWKKGPLKNQVRFPSGGKKFYDPTVGEKIFGNFLKDL